ncbi:MAG: MEDS domain-containing protein [Desulfohalobiaceae bacterium]
MSDLSSLLDLSPGDHLCCMYMTEAEHQEVLVPFIRDGLQQSHRVIYIVDARTAETVLGYLRQEGLDPEQDQRSGSLIISSSQDTYLRNGSFDPDSMLSLLHKEVQQAEKEGFQALRVTGEMSWALRGLPGSERLMEYEAKLNHFFPGHKAIGLCQYDMRRFEPDVLLDVLATHPIAVVRNVCYENMYYVPPDEFLSTNRAQTELEHRLSNLEEHRQMQARREQLEAELRQSEEQARKEAEFSNAILDNAGALIVVLDDQGRIVRFNRTSENLTGYSAQEVQGRTFWEILIPEEDVPPIRKTFQELSCGKFPNRLENDWLDKNGERIRVSWSNTCLLDTEHNVDLVVSIGLDVTELAMLERTRNRELSSLQQYSDNHSTRLTASSLGLSPLNESSPQDFQTCKDTLQDLLEQAMQRNIYKIKQDLSGQLRDLAEYLGRLHASPRDLIQAYIQALQGKTRGLSTKMSRAYTDEGRLLLLEIMGYLAAYYFQHCLLRGEKK